MSSQNTKNNQNSLYVGNLHEEVDEHVLYDLFKDTAPITSIFVCRNYEQKSLGYAYVNFMSHENAKSAMENFKHTMIEGREIRIMFAQSDPTVRKSGVGNIFVRNLPKDVGSKDLEELFSSFGTILSCIVPTTMVKGEAVSNGYGMVHFEDPESANKAIAELNGKFVNDCQIQVTHYKTKSERPSKSKDEVFTNVYIKNIPLTMDNDGLKTLFEEFGPIQNVSVQVTEDGKSKGFGFVNFEKHEDAVKAIEGLNGRNAGDEEDKEKTFVVNRFQSKHERAEILKKEQQEKSTQKQETNLYVRHLPDEFDENDLRELFQDFGEITSVRIMRDQKKKTISRGFGFVCFAKSEDASRAIQEMHNKLLSNNKPLFVALHQPKQERKTYVERMKRESISGVMMPPMAYPMPAHPAMQYPMYPHPQVVWGQQMGGPIMPVGDKKQQLGNQLYSRVAAHDAENAGKITGMFLELDEAEIAELLHDDNKLQARVNEARQVLQKSA